MYALMCYENALSTKCLITHFTSIRTFTTMYSLMFCKTALLCEGSITHFTWICTLVPTYITGISVFSSVYVKFVQSTLVKTQRLNTRIYCDRKNDYFYSYVYIKEKSRAFEKLLFTKSHNLNNFVCNLFFKSNSSFNIYITLILEWYMQCILEHCLNNSTNTITECTLFLQFLLNGDITFIHYGWVPQTSPEKTEGISKT
jgi:hypothetical protein